MSFTTTIKQEIARNELKLCCKKAEMAALVKLTSSISISNKGFKLYFKSENATTMKRIVYLLKSLYKTNTEIVVGQKNNLKKNKVYSLTADDGMKILEDLGLYANGLRSYPTSESGIVRKDCCKKAYLAGCFLAYGACNSPSNKNYHLEISVSDLDLATYIVKLISNFGIEAKISKRRNKYVVYLKKADVISDFLKIIGSNEAMYEFEDSRMERDLMHSVIRVNNCEIANEMKSLKAANDQVEYMEAIKKADKYKDLDSKLKNVIDIRLANQDASLNELCKVYEKKYKETLSKSGLKHRLNKIESIARSI